MYVDPSLPVFTEDPSSFFIQGMVTVKSSPNFSMVGLWILIFVCMSIHSWPNIAFYVKFDNLSIGLNMYFLTFRLWLGNPNSFKNDFPNAMGFLDDYNKFDGCNLTSK